MTELNYNEWKFWFDVIQMLGTVLLGVYVYISNRHRITGDTIKDHHDRLITLESELKHLPNKEKLKEISIRLDTVNNDLQRTIGKFEGVNRAVDLINEFLINQGGGKR